MSAPPTTPRIGHNRPPGTGWNRYAWARARRELKPARVPLEIVRLRVRRARALGLDYPQYASILLGSGRDIVGFLFTVDGLSLKLRRRLEAPEVVSRKLRAIGCDRLALSPPEEPAEAFRAELEEVTAAGFAAVAPAPPEGAPWSAGRAAIRAALAPLRLPSDAVVMIGGREGEARWSEAARLAGYLSGEGYFGDAV